VKLHDVILFVARIRIELPKGELLEAPHGCGGIRVDTNRIPGLENLRPQVENLVRWLAKCK
jgi:hypothetical protein